MKPRILTGLGDAEIGVFSLENALGRGVGRRWVLPCRGKSRECNDGAIAGSVGLPVLGAEFGVGFCSNGVYLSFEVVGEFAVEVDIRI